MSNFQVPPNFATLVKSLARSMPRERYQRGSLRRVGKRRKKWEGLYHVYVMMPDGTERRFPRTKIIGLCADMSKTDAQMELDRLIAVATQQRGSLPVDPSFAELWKRFTTIKEATWGSATKRSLCSVIEGHVLPVIGKTRLRELTRDPLQMCLNDMAKAGASYSALHKARTYIAAALDYAVDEKAIPANPAERVDVPRKLITGRVTERFYSLDECRNLLSQAEGRELLIIRIFLVCGLRPAELFALRVDDVEDGRLRIDEALKETEKGARRVGETKTVTSSGYVFTGSLKAELEGWLIIRQAASPSDFLFPSEAGTPFQIRNYLNRILKPLGEKAGIADMTYQALRRTFATHFQRHGTPRSAQAAMRHASMHMTGWYTKEIPEEVVKSIASWDAELRAKPAGRVM